MTSDLGTDRLLKGGIALAPRAELCATIVGLCAERDALAAALADIAAGECWQTRCPDGDLCDVCTARKALGMLV